MVRPSANAQQAAKVYRIGLLWDGPTVFADAIDAFRKSLRDLGYVEGRNIVIEYLCVPKTRFVNIGDEDRRERGGM